MPEMNYNTQYQDLINKLIQSKPKPTIDPLTLALLTFGDKVNQTTSMPQTNRLGSGLNEAFKTFGEETNKQNTSMRLWDAQNVDFLRAVLTDETAKAKAKAETEQRIFENELKVKEDLRKQQEAEAKAREGSALSDYLKGTFDDMSPTKDNLMRSVLNQEYPQVKINDISAVIGKMNPDLQKEILKTTLPKEEKGWTPELKKFINKSGNIRDVNMNNLSDVADARAKGFTEYKEPITATGGAVLAHQLRNEVKGNPYVKEFQDVNNKYGVMQKAYEMSKKTNNFVAIDQALISLFNKMTDPSSVVRESEYVRTPQNLSILNRFKGAIGKYGYGGAGINQADRKALIDMANEFYNSYSTNYDETINNYKELAKETGISEKLVGIPYDRKNKEQIPDLSKISTDELKRMLNE